MFALNFKALVIGGLALAVFTVAAGSAIVKAQSGGTKPGWGYGDTNHVHTGPGGESVSLRPTSAHAK